MREGKLDDRVELTPMAYKGELKKGNCRAIKGVDAGDVSRHADLTSFDSTVSHVAYLALN